ncbi:hypothetical protein REPUB_Repub02eG0085500 [Reevesia pubescens]
MAIHVLRDCKMAKEVWNCSKGLWESRNDMLDKGICKKSSEVVNKVQFLLEDFRNAKQEKDIPRNRGHSNSHWVAPNAGFVKVNLDVAIFKEMGAIGVGVAIRDSGGNVLALLSKKMKMCADAYVAECLALYEALMFALEVGLRNIVAEGDSSLTIGAVNSSSLDHSIAGGIVEAIKILSQSCNSFKLTMLEEAEMKWLIL